MIYKILTLLCVAAVGAALVLLPTAWNISVVILLLTALILLSRIDAMERIEEAQAHYASLVNRATERIESLAGSVHDFRAALDRNVAETENTLNRMREEYRAEITTFSEDFAAKIIEIENRLSAVRKTLGASFGALEDRIHEIEEEETGE